ncbi:MAG: family 43 glycosylhydrolase [Novosphingobium sp.]
MPDIDRRTLIAAAGASAAVCLSSRAGAAAASWRFSSFRPGQVWLDTAGKPIQVRGGSLMQIGDTVYWYGENKERTTGKDRIWHWGVRCYTSKDLYNWDDAGVIIPPEPNDPTSPLHPHSYMDRPHILFNKQTRKFVCWLKFLSEPWQTRAVLVADRITGPYTLIRKGQRPLGMGAGDFDLVISPDDQKGYMFFERVHSEMIVADLTDDYTDFTGFYSTHLPRPGPPTVREGPAYFRRRGKHYLATSGTTGYFPNPSEIAIADTFHGPWTTLGDLHPGDKSRTSYNSQISTIFKHPAKKDLYIAIADRWNGTSLSGPKFESGALSHLVQNAFAKRFAQPSQPLSPDEDRAMRRYGGLDINTSQGRHVWLPIRFEGERPFIDWRSEWSLDEFA